MILEEEDWIRKAQQGDTNAMGALFKHHYSFLYKYLLKITMNHSVAEDTAQDTVIRCMENIARYNGTSSFSSWMITIATRLYIDRTRRNKRETKWLENEQRRSVTQLRWQMERQGEQWTDLLDGLAQLSDEHRIAILLKHYYGYSYEEIGSMLGIPAGTVKSRTAYGIKQLRKELNAHDEQT
ncbi:MULTISPECIES: RNA polymerase sigma factor SigY [Paenibacillus]|uniref:RNA polymerase sigma factor SigY n=1 Tax=Paenibacillus campinasensis TaxID=66347 RepID=A0A268EMN6_9BACL|nr:RNA polymerase sigma factor SigY [Paenibacillus campinasensis]MUG66949.1 RNA polymerase sigma factor SigY [Paenibacillus campinasensis]PAD74373.1 RNA polymerase sigma factor SigY [Paenibacillus campinasensis]